MIIKCPIVFCLWSNAWWGWQSHFDLKEGGTLIEELFAGNLPNEGVEPVVYTKWYHYNDW